MGLQGHAGRRGERGYAMAALLVALAVMAVLLTVAMPVWRHEAQREKEAELVFRGEQYARAIALFRFKNAQNPNVFPPTVDYLVEQKFLRKKYKDPMTKDGEFAVLGAGQSQQPGIQPPQGQGTGGGGRRGAAPPVPSTPGPASPIAVGGISGVHSKSQETSIRAYRGATRYDQWMFTFNNVPRPGGAVQPGQQPGNNPGNTPNPFGPRGGGNGGGRSAPPFPGRTGGPVGPGGFGPGGFGPGSAPQAPPPTGRPGGPGRGQ